MKRINRKKVLEAIESAGMNHSQASAAINASHSYIDKSLSKGTMSEPYFYAFCNAFNVTPAEIGVYGKVTPKEANKSVRSLKRRGVQIDGRFCRELLKDRGLLIDKTSMDIGASHGYLSMAFKENSISEKYLDSLADFLKVDKKVLINGKLEEPETAQLELPLIKDAPIEEMTINKAFYNLATSLEAALTNFRQDLLMMEETANGQV